MLEAQFGFSENDSQTFVNYLKMDEGRTNIKKFIILIQH